MYLTYVLVIASQAKSMHTENQEKILSYENLSSKLYPTLSLVEISLYTVTWIYGVCMAFYSFYIASQMEGRSLSHVTLVSPWWKFWSASILRDGTDMEWNIWKILALHVGGLVVLYPLLSHLCKRFFNQSSLLFCVIYSVTVIIYLIGMLPTLFLFLQIFVMWAAYQTNSAKLVWFVAVSYIICLNLFPLKTMKDSLFPDEASQHFQGPLTSVFLAVMNMRCISFSLDRIWKKMENESFFTSFLMLTAFCFYLPLLLVGPTVSSKTFKDSFEKPLQTLDRNLFVNICFQCLRYGLWFTITDVSIYYMYHQAFSMHMEKLYDLDLWALCGMGYFMAHFFHLKYTVMYGLTGLLARLDNVAAPAHPKCISRFHLASDVWRHFDYGYYLFFREYIYLPAQAHLPSNMLNRFIASALCFSFMFIWHGILPSIFIWSTLNFLCSICEGLARAVGRNTTYQQWEFFCFGPLGIRRLHALLNAPLRLMGQLSFLYVFFPVEVCHIFMWRVLFESWPWGLPTIIFFFYCLSHVSIEVKNYEIKKHLMAFKEKEE